MGLSPTVTARHSESWFVFVRRFIATLSNLLDAFSTYLFRTQIPSGALWQPPYVEHQWCVHSGPLVLGAAPSILQRPRQIGTELSHDVLNPARVPL